MKKSTVIFLVFLLLSIVLTVPILLMREVKQPILPSQSITEDFILKHLETSKHLIRTNVTDRREEYLSESVGLWLYYLQEVENKGRFAQQFEAFDRYFYQAHRAIPWIVEQTKRSDVNALIDDLRIMVALEKASDAFQVKSYRYIAEDIANFTATHQIRNDVLVDFYDQQVSYASESITLSYILPEGYDYLKQQKLLTTAQYNKNKALLLEAPLENGFFPKSYEVLTQQYQFDGQINMIDQYYVGFHRAQWGGNVDNLVDFTKRQLQQHRVVYGNYTLGTGQPSVEFESASAYALAILMMLEIDEQLLAQQLFTAMRKLRVEDPNSEYYGGYIDIWSKDTHMFDNVLPLIAERRGVHAGVFKE